MSTGLATTFRWLQSTGNEAVVPLLLTGLDSPHAPIREKALEALMARQSQVGNREILARVPTMDEGLRETLCRRHTMMTKAFRDAILGGDRTLCANACLAAIWTRDYELIPVLLAMMEDSIGPQAEFAAGTFTKLIDLLSGELSDPSDDLRYREIQLSRQRVEGSLEQSIARFIKHKRREVLEAFLLVVHRDNAVLRSILDDPYHAAFVSVVEFLSKSSATSVIRLLLSFLDDPHAPSVIVSLIGRRSDSRFLQYLLRKIGHSPSAVARQNLKRMTAIGWTQGVMGLLAQLDDQEQHAAVKMLSASGVPRDEVFPVLQQILLYGKRGGRRAAIEALGEFTGVEANDLAVKALDDTDPVVQANALGQLRKRGVPSAMPRLLKMLDSPHAVVRRAVRESLSEFSCRRYLAAFDALEDDVRQSTGMLVKKIDPQTIPILMEELASQARARRFRALQIAQAIEAVPQLETGILKLIEDEDHLIRAEAAAALRHGTSPASLMALESALSDRSTSVQESARSSLQDRTQFQHWRETLADPRD